MATKKSKKAKKAKAAKKAQAKKAPEKKAQVAKGRPSKLADNAVIRVLVAKNPKRPDSKAGKRFDLYKKDMTVAQFLKAGGWRADLRWDLKQGFIEVENPS